MKISLNMLKQFVDIPAQISNQELIKLIGARLVEVEEVVDWGKKYENCVIAEVVECEKIPDTHLSLCQISDGKQKHQVVCGAPNVRTGILVAWLKPGAIVPSTFGGENFSLGVRKLRGHESNGMLASLAELDLGEDHDGILELDQKYCQVGDNFADTFALNDIIIDIENKSLTHRPDTFGIIGFAREVAGILGVKFHEPMALEPAPSDIDPAISIQIDTELCGRYSAAVIDLEQQNFDTTHQLDKDIISLLKSGMKPISDLVDLSNNIMLLTGQPLHIFDYNKFIAVGGTAQPVIGVRAGKTGEKLELLDGKIIELDANDIVITSGDKPVALAGAMGGVSTAVDDTTTKILVESATFSLYHLRKTQMKHGIFTEAITRFTKGVPTIMSYPTLKFFIDKLKALDPSSSVLSISSIGIKQPQPQDIVVKITTINQLLGSDYSAEQITQTLKNVGITTKYNTSSDELTVTTPAWRNDLSIWQDIAEEVGRLLGFDNIPATMPRLNMRTPVKNQLFALKKRLRDCLSQQISANEVLTYSFVSHKLEEKAGIDPNDSYEIANSISPSLQTFRQFILPSLIEKIQENVRLGFTDFAFYEINQTTSKQNGLSSEGVPIMNERLAMGILGNFYDTKWQAQHLFDTLGITVEFSEANEQGITNFTAAPAFFEPNRTVSIVVGGKTIGYLGEISQTFKRALKIKTEVSGLEFDLSALIGQEKKPIFKEISRFPAVHRDLTVKIPQGKFSDLAQVLNDFNPASVDFSWQFISAYQKDDSPISYTFRIKLVNYEKTLLSDEISAIMDSLNDKFSAKGAEI